MKREKYIWVVSTHYTDETTRRDYYYDRDKIDYQLKSKLEMSECKDVEIWWMIKNNHAVILFQNHPNKFGFLKVEASKELIF